MVTASVNAVAGKPTAATYRFVEERLRSLAPEDDAPPTASTEWCFYMVPP